MSNQPKSHFGRKTDPRFIKWLQSQLKLYLDIPAATESILLKNPKFFPDLPMFLTLPRPLLSLFNHKRSSETDIPICKHPLICAYCKHGSVQVTR